MSREWLFIAASAVWMWTNLIEPFQLRLQRRSLILSHLSPRLDGLTILHLSDLHVRKLGLLERKLIRLLSQTPAHIAVLTGDLLDSPGGIQPLREVLAHLRSTLGAYAVWGNAEHKPSGTSHRDALKQTLADVGVQVLTNEAASLTYGDATIWLAGVDDPHSGHDDLAPIAPTARRADLHLLLAHSPDILRHQLSARFDLILCGHTHCGQIRIPGWGALWSHTRLGRWAGDCLLTPERIARRLNRPQPQPTAVVSPGVATVGGLLFKARLFCPPAVTLIELRTTASAPARTPRKASPTRGI